MAVKTVPHLLAPAPTVAALQHNLVKDHPLPVQLIHSTPFRFLLGDAPSALAVEIFFSQNTFHFASATVLNGWTTTHPKYTLRLRKIGVDAIEGRFVGLASALKRCKALEDVTIGVDEAGIVEEMARSDNRYPKSNMHLTPNDLDRQLNLLVLRQYGIDALRALRFRNVAFTTFKHGGRSTSWHSRETGPIPCGILETVIAQEMMTPCSEFVQTRKRKSTHSTTSAAKRLQIALVSKHLVYIHRKASPEEYGASKPFRLLDLPGELRNRIYEYVLQVDGKINPSRRVPTTHHRAGLNQKVKDKYREGPARSSVLALLQVNKQIHQEAAGIYYGQNEFTFYHPNQLMMFLASVSETRKSYIQKISLWYENSGGGGVDSVDSNLLALMQLKGLKVLDVIYDPVLHYVKFPTAGEALLKQLVDTGVDVQCKSLHATRFLFDGREGEDSARAVEIETGLRELEALQNRLAGGSEESAPPRGRK